MFFKICDVKLVNLYMKKKLYEKFVYRNGCEPGIESTEQGLSELKILEMKCLVEVCGVTRRIKVRNVNVK